MSNQSNYSKNSPLTYLFTSESVGEGHPDKLCDQVSDSVLDFALSLDPAAHVACECFTTTNFLLVGGEVKFLNNPIENRKKLDTNLEDLVRKVVKDIGYTSEEVGLDYKTMQVLNKIHSQSPDIAQGVEGAGLKEFEGKQGAGDQGIMFGFACTETPSLMPLPIISAHNILKEADKLRKSGEIPFLRPDAKSQVTVEYLGYTPIRIDTVVLSHQHDAGVSYEEIKEALVEKVIKPVLLPTGLLKDTRFLINPTGSFVKGGPDGDAGLTGRKIIVDTYGGAGRHGGGAFSGKDPSKVDRSAAYMARYIAKNVVKAGLCSRAEVQLAYAIGVPYPVSIMLNSFGTENYSVKKIEEAIGRVFDCSPSGIVKTLDLCRPIYRKTSTYGHFGRKEFPWEATNKAGELKECVEKL